MARHTESLALLPGAEYEVATETLFIDVAKFRGMGGSALLEIDTFGIVAAVYRGWLKAMPNHKVRFITIKGAV